MEWKTGMMGAPLTGSDFKLVNWEEGNYLVTDKPNPRGEIHVSGSIVCDGYYKQPEKTKEDFYEDENGVRWFKTGDIGEFNHQGALEVNSLFFLILLMLTMTSFPLF